MKKNALFLLLLALLMAGGLYVSRTQQVPFVEQEVELSSSGVPGDGFLSGDDCGYLMGASMVYRGYHVDVDTMPDNFQACADASGNFYEGEELFSIRDSQAKVVYNLAASSVEYTLDFVGTSYGVTVDQTTGYWSGYAKIIDPSYTGSNPWVWFDWDCVGEDGEGGAYCGGAVSDRSYQVHTNLETGEVRGYAWNDDMGFLSFRNLTMELPPHEIQMIVDVLANETDGVTPDNVTLETAPYSDFAQYWRVRVQWLDTTSGEYLDGSDLLTETIRMPVTTVGQVFLDQVSNDGDAIEVSAYNPYVSCTDSSAQYCGMTESDGSWSANMFIYSGSPTSNMLGYEDNMDGDWSIDHFLDREGCGWIYTDQWRYVRSLESRPSCSGASASDYSKDDVFYLRENDRNMVGIESITMGFEFSEDREYAVTVASGSLVEVPLAVGTSYYYTPDYNGDLDGDGFHDGLYLSFKPRFQPVSYRAIYNGEEYMQISSDYATPMSLETKAVIANASLQAQERGVALKPGLTVYDQLDSVSDTDEALPEDLHLVLDTQYLLDSTVEADTDLDCSYAQLSLSEGSYPTGSTYVHDYTMGYGQRSSTCTGATPTGTASNNLTQPTAEQWVCDDVIDHFGSTVPSCYYTGYLPIVDRYDDPEAMLLIGSINSVLNDQSVLMNEEQISILGSTETIKLRNRMYSQVVRYTLGQVAGAGTLDADMNVSSGGIVELMNGRLLFAQGDVTVDGSSGFAGKTLVVVGGDVYLKGNITGGRLGVVVFQEGGTGGNVYIAPEVTDLYANFFLDGAFYSYSGTGAVTTEFPVWSSDEDRVETLKNQLYLNGSLVARNTVNGSETELFDGQYSLGDGTMGEYVQARERDLNKIRQYRLCWPVDPVTGLPDESDAGARQDCEEAALSSYRDEYGDPVYKSFILEYAPPTDIVIFTVENSLTDL